MNNAINSPSYSDKMSSSKIPRINVAYFPFHLISKTAVYSFLSDGFTIYVQHILDNQIKMTHKRLCYNGV